jgi:translation initiation factor eIF-2B subunit alpha
MAICAKEMKKSLYVLTESFKFSRIYPLNQVDLPDEFKVSFKIIIEIIKYNHYKHS